VTSPRRRSLAAATAPEQVLAVAAVDRVPAVAADEQVISRAALEPIGAVVADDEVVARLAADQIRLGRPDQLSSPGVPLMLAMSNS
jgi:hypothetical protein